MFINKDSLKINGISIGKYITEATYGFYDTWSSDTGYNTLSGNFVGTFKGTYPKITVKFAKSLSIADLETLTTSIFRTISQTIVYDDPDGTTKTITTHKGDLALKFTGIKKKEAFSYDFVGNNPL
jgi:hypothetical protein